MLGLHDFVLRYSSILPEGSCFDHEASCFPGMSAYVQNFFRSILILQSPLSHVSQGMSLHPVGLEAEEPEFVPNVRPSLLDLR